jgi:hypothetical protein
MPKAQVSADLLERRPVLQYAQKHERHLSAIEVGRGGCSADYAIEVHRRDRHGVVRSRPTTR